MADILDTRGVVRQDHKLAGTDLGGTMRAALHLTGALMSLGLLVGVGIWGYRIMVRDVTGIPVVRAIEGPMRVQPENPGGDPADHQGLAVNSVAADGSAAPPADRLVLAPRPVDLTDEDLPKPDLRTPSPSAQQTDAGEGTSADIDALIAQLVGPEADGAGRIVQPTPLVIGQAPQAAPSASPAIDGQSGLARSLRPRLRPSAVTSETVSAQNSAEDVAALVDIDVAPEDVPVGTRVVQFGAYDTPEVARAEWDRLNVRFGDYLAGKRRIVQEAQSGGRTFYRLRAMGFVDLSDARRFCSALVAEGADCIPVVTR